MSLIREHRFLIPYTTNELERPPSAGSLFIFGIDNDFCSAPGAVDFCNKNRRCRLGNVSKQRRRCDDDGWKQLVDGTDHGRDAHAVVDLLHEGADCLHYFRCRARVACPDQLAHLIAAALPDLDRRLALCVVSAD